MALSLPISLETTSAIPWKPRAIPWKSPLGNEHDISTTTIHLLRPLQLLQWRSGKNWFFCNRVSDLRQSSLETTTNSLEITSGNGTLHLITCVFHGELQVLRLDVLPKLNWNSLWKWNPRLPPTSPVVMVSESCTQHPLLQLQGIIMKDD